MHTVYTIHLVLKALLNTSCSAFHHSHQFRVSIANYNRYPSIYTSFPSTPIDGATPSYLTSVTMSEPPSWKAIAARKQAERLSRIPSGWRLDEATLSVAASATCVLDVPRKSGILSARELEITETEDATMLLEDLLAKRRSSVEVVTAFCKRAAIAQQVVSPVSPPYQAIVMVYCTRQYHVQKHAIVGSVASDLRGLPRFFGVVVA